MKTTLCLACLGGLLTVSCSSTKPAPEPPRIAGTENPAALRALGDDESALAPETPWEEWSFGVGGLLAALDSGARFGPAGVGVEVNFEDLFDLDSSTTSFRLAGSWRFSENRRHRVSVAWIDLGRSGEKTLEQDVIINDSTTLPAGTGVVTGFGLDLIKTEYSYSFFQDDRVDLAAAFGLYVAPIDVSLEAPGFGGYEESFNVTAPLPLLGMRMDFALTPKWILRNSVSLFYLEVSEYSGGMTDALFAVEYLAWKHLAVGLGFNSFRIGVEHNGSTDIPGVNSRGKVDISYTGAMLYLKGLW